MNRSQAEQHVLNKLGNDCLCFGLTNKLKALKALHEHTKDPKILPFIDEVIEKRKRETRVNWRLLNAISDMISPKFARECASEFPKKR